MALSFSIENILARPTYRPIAPASTMYTIVQPHYPFVITSNNYPVSINNNNLPPFASTRKRRKRYRTIFSELQIELLEELFKTTQYPDLYQRENVALKAGLQEERVEVWFKNRRARDRKLKRASQNTKSSKNKDKTENSEKEREQLTKTSNNDTLRISRDISQRSK